MQILITSMILLLYDYIYDYFIILMIIFLSIGASLFIFIFIFNDTRFRPFLDRAIVKIAIMHICS